ncbi:MAG: glycosyltransferase family 4 protein [Candidatus Melainabacteria bacterium]|nr:glycosyltransferase family 4 protein [Candidatus Melainabacteria bacterium]
MESKTDVLILLTDLFDKSGGIQTFNRCLVKALQEITLDKKLNIVVLVLSDNGRSKIQNFYLNSEFIKYIYCNGSKVRFIFYLLVNFLKFSIIVVGHISFLPLIAVLKIFSLRIKIFLIIYGVEATKKLSFLYKSSIGCLNKILYISSYTLNKMISVNNLKSKLCKIDQNIFPCTLDPVFYSKLVLKNRQELNLPEGKIILTVSRLDSNNHYKNIDLLIESMSEVLKIISNVFCIIVGDGSDRERLEQLTKNKNLQDKVLFTGEVTNKLLPSYFNECNLFVLPSTEEGFGIVFLEAMYFSKLVIGARAGAVPEVIDDGITGLLVEPNNTSDLTKCIIKALSDKSLQDKIGTSGKKKLENIYSFETYKQRLRKILCL